MSDQSKKTILVVDDESRMVRFVKMNLDLEGYLTIEANNGQQALEKVRDFNPDLVLLDVEMPGMDGFETLKRLREVTEAAVIMLTVRADEEDRIPLQPLGGVDGERRRQRTSEEPSAEETPSAGIIAAAVPVEQISLELISHDRRAEPAHRSPCQPGEGVKTDRNGSLRPFPVRRGD